MKNYICLIISSLVLLFFISCDEPTKPDNNNQPPQTIVSGIVNQITQAGNFPSDSCKITIIASDISSITFTNDDGLFADTIYTNDVTLKILIEKDGFGTRDTTIQISAAQGLNFTLNFNRIEVSGRLYEINTNGTFPLANCGMHIYTRGVDYFIHSNDDGYFTLTTNQYNGWVSIKIDRDEYVSIDTTISLQNCTGLELFLDKYVYFLPLNIGNRWTFSTSYQNGGDIWWSEFFGEEQWELIELANDSSWFKIQTYFNGHEIQHDGGQILDTIYYSNEVAQLLITNDSGVLSLQSRTGSNISALGEFFFVSNLVIANEPHILFPASRDSINFYYEGNFFDFLRYTIVREDGFDLLDVQWVSPTPDLYKAKLERIE